LISDIFKNDLLKNILTLVNLFVTYMSLTAYRGLVISESKIKQHLEYLLKYETTIALEISVFFQN